MHRLPFTSRRACGRPPRAAQRGATLIVGLIMLLLVTLLAVAGVRMTTTQVQVTANEQFRADASAAANYALDLALNTPNFTNPALLPALPAVSTQQVTHAEDPQALAVSYQPAPQCQRFRYLKNSELVVENSASPDATCLRSSTPGSIAIVHTGASGSAEDNSLCVTTLWELGARVEDPQTGANVTVIQGVEIRMEISDAENSCS